MPFRMHSQYLRSLFLKNDLAEGRFKVAGRPVALPDIRLPLFVVSTERDHVAPWRSVFKFHLLTETHVTFVLTNGGHNAGILSEPGHPHRHFRMAAREQGEPYIDPDSGLPNMGRMKVHGGRHGARGSPRDPASRRTAAAR